jgi:hypothetical protein
MSYRDIILLSVEFVVDVVYNGLSLILPNSISVPLIWFIKKSL